MTSDGCRVPGQRSKGSLARSHRRAPSPAAAKIRPARNPRGLRNTQLNLGRRTLRRGLISPRRKDIIPGSG